MDETTSGAPEVLAGIPAAGLVDPGVLLAGALDALGLRLAGEARLEDDGFHAGFHGRLFGMECSGRLLGGTPWDPRGLRAEVRVQGDVPALSAAAGRLVREGVARAQAELARLQAQAEGGDLTARVEREAARLRDEATRLRDAADAAVVHAQQAVDETAVRLAALDARLDAARASVDADRAQLDEGLCAATARLEQAREQGEALRRELDAHNAWFQGLSPADRLWHAVPHAVKRAALQTAHDTASAVLELARGAVDVARRTREAWSPDADPRVVSVLAERALVASARDAAAGTLAGARAALHQLPEWVHDVRLLAAEAARQVASADDVEVARRLREARQALGGAAALAQRLADAEVLPVEVRELTFTTGIGPAAEPRAAARGRIAVLQPDGGRREEEVELELNLANPAEAAPALAARVLGGAA